VPGSLLRACTRVLRVVLPPRIGPDVLVELGEEHARRSAADGRRRADAWVCRETTALVGGSLATRGIAAARHLPLLAREWRMAVRSARRHPFAGLASASMLAVGLASSVAAWSLTEALVNRPVSPVHGDALRRVVAIDRNGQSRYTFSHVEIETMRQHLGEKATLAAVNLQPAVLGHGPNVWQILAEVVSGGYPALVGGPMRLGRPLLRSDDRPGAAPAAVISERLWRDRLGGEAAILGDTVRLNTTVVTVVGVSRGPGSSSLLGGSVDVWIAAAHADAMLNPGWRTSPADRWWRAIVLPGAGGVAELETGLRLARESLANAVPEPWRDRRLATEPAFVLESGLRRTARTLMRVLGVLAVLLLAVAAANVGGALLAAAATDERQTAVRRALGASRGLLVMRRLLEGVLVGGAGAAGAVGLYAWARTRMAEVALQPTLALRLDLPLDGPIVAALLVAGPLAGLLLASGPAIWSTRADLADALRNASPRASAIGIARARRVLVAAQVAMSVGLIVGAALFARTLGALAAVDAGFPRAGLAAMDFDLEPSGPAAMDVDALSREALSRVRALPVISAAAYASRAPVDRSTPLSGVRRAGDAAPIGDATYLMVTDGYFDTVGIPMVAGRAFVAAEVAREEPVAVVNESLSARLWPGADAVGRALVIDRLDRTFRVVGVARDAKYRSLTEVGALHVYVATPPRFGLALLLRSAGDAREALRDAQRVLDTVGPGLVGFFPRTADDHLAPELLTARVAARAASALGMVALLLSTLGLYAVIRWHVETRRREIGVRMAIGASAGDVRALVVRQALATALPGAAAGLSLAAILGLAAQALLYGVAPLDPWAMAAGLAAVTAIVAAASYGPCRVATRVDPVSVLRE
jgi:predicted permease